MYVKKIHTTLFLFLFFVLGSSAQNIRAIDHKGTLQTFNPWRLNGNSTTTANANFLGTINNAALRFRTNNTERLTISETGYVGIGTTAPTNNLDVVGGFNLRNVGGAMGSNYGIEFTTNLNSPRIDWVYNGSYTGSFASDSDHFFRLENRKVGSGGFRFITNSDGTNIERLTILNNGHMGVGIANPNSKFEIIQSSAYGETEEKAHGIQVSSGKNNTDYTLYMGADKTSGVSYLQSVKWSVGLAPLTLNARGGRVGIGTASPSSLLHVKGNTAAITLECTSGKAPDDQAFIKVMNKDGGAFQIRNLSGPSDGFSITNGRAPLMAYITGLSNGNIGIGTETPSQKLQVVGNVLASAMLIPSDGRLKSNIVDIENGLSKIMQLHPVSYDKQFVLDQPEIMAENGFVAQEVQQILPEIVSQGKDKAKLLAVNYTSLIPVLTKAIQEQQQQIEAQKVQLLHMLELNQSLLKRLEALEQKAIRFNN